MEDRPPPEASFRGEMCRRDDGSHHQADTSVRDSQPEVFVAGTSL